MNRLVAPVLWIGLGVAVGVGAMLTSERVLARQQSPSVLRMSQDQTQAIDNPTFVLKIAAPAGMTSVECVSGCTFNEAKVFVDGTKRNFQTPSFQFGCKDQTCEWSAVGVISH